MAATRPLKATRIKYPTQVEFFIAPRWLPVRWLAIKYGMDYRTAKRWVMGQGKDCYRLRVIKTPAGLRVLDPQLEYPPQLAAEPDQMFIYRASEVAKLLGVSKRWVNLLAAKYKIRYRLYGNKRFFSVSEVRRLLVIQRGCPELDKQPQNVVGRK